jgi:tight adherence protein C
MGMDSDLLGGIYTFLTFLVILGGGFFLVYGLWEALVKRFLSEAQELEERSLVKALRKVILRKLAVINRRFIWPKYEKRINRRVLNAGGLDGLTAEEFMALQQVAFVAFVIFGGILINFLRGSLGMDLGWSWLVAFALLGILFPEIWLRDQVAKRHFKITRELPYNLDLLTLSVEAGLDFQAAVDTVVKKGRQGPLTGEFSLMLREMRMGKTRQDALRGISERVGLAPLSSFVAALIQADRMGTSLGKVLRIQSTQLRIERTQRAEKLANEAPVKMLFPLIACIFPTVFLVLSSPIIFQFVFGNVGG